MRGWFVTIEGVDGSGKTTVTQMLARWLAEKGLSVTVTFEPGGTVLGKAIRELVLTNEKTAMWAEIFLFLADRVEHVAKVILPALERGEIVLSDRFVDSTIAYQGFGLGLDVERLIELNRIATNGLMPDLTLLLDIDPQIGLIRSQQKDSIANRPIEFHRKVREGYLWLANREPHRIKVVDASLPLDRVVCNAQRLIDEALRLLGCF